MSLMNGGARLSSTALAADTSANGTARNGASLATGTVEFDTLCILCTTTIVTGSVVATYKIQVSNDGTNWYDLRPLSNTAPTTVTASGSVVLAVPGGVVGFIYCRAVATLSGAATAAGDTTAVTYNFVKFDEAR